MNRIPRYRSAERTVWHLHEGPVLLRGEWLARGGEPSGPPRRQSSERSELHGLPPMEARRGQLLFLLPRHLARLFEHRRKRLLRNPREYSDVAAAAQHPAVRRSLGESPAAPVIVWQRTQLGDILGLEADSLG